MLGELLAPMRSGTPAAAEAGRLRCAGAAFRLEAGAVRQTWIMSKPNLQMNLTKRASSLDRNSQRKYLRHRVVIAKLHPRVRGNVEACQTPLRDLATVFPASARGLW